MASKECITEAAGLAGAFSNATRLAIVGRLAAGPCLVGELAAAVGLGQAVVSKQLGILKAAGLLKCQTDGRCREYALADPDDTRAFLGALQNSAMLAARNARRCREQQTPEASIENPAAAPSPAQGVPNRG